MHTLLKNIIVSSKFLILLFSFCELIQGLDFESFAICSNAQ